MTMTETVQPAESPPSFDSFGLSDEVSRALEEMGYNTPTPVQLATFGPTAEGKDLIVQARTGTGKTAAFGIPLVDRRISDKPGVQALILAPTRELALQSAREIQRIGKYRNTRTVAVYGGAPMNNQVDELRKGGQIISGTPGRVLDHLRRGTFDPSDLAVLVLDEMDEMLSMGFARELNAILELLPSPRQTMCFSATVERDVIRIAQKHMQDPQHISLSSDAVGATDVSHFVYMVSGTNRTADLIQILECEDPESAIVFCNMRSETERVAQDLTQAGFDADWLNGDLPQSEREKIMQRTRRGELRYLVATDVAARGIDISHLTHVINYTFPDSPAQYVHRTGRTGRAGRTGTAISLVSPAELGSLYYLRLEYRIFPVERSLPSAGELRTRREADLIELLDKALPGTPKSDDTKLAHRLLTHPAADTIIAKLLGAFLGTRSDASEEAAAARRSRNPSPAAEAPRRRRPAARAAASQGETAQSRAPKGRARDQEDNFSTLFLNLGRKDGVRVGEVAKLVREHCGLARSEIGRIRVRERYTYVGVPEDRLDEVVTKLQGQQLHDRTLAPERAKVSK